LVIAALAVIVFSIVGMATISGWMPRAMVGATPAVTADARLTPNRDAPREDLDLRTVGAFECAECGVIESIREIERGPVSNASFENFSAPTLAQQGQRF
jgi:hypothetical protein